MPHQIPPQGDWRNWVLMGGRGAGKTRAGAEWVRGLVEGASAHDKGSYKRIALISETLDQAREVMIFGESGILACTPNDRKPQWIASRKMLIWPNGATAQIFSASEPESFRGPQFDAAWLDEFGKWKKAEHAWDMLQFALRLGDDPKVMISTTPRNVPILKSIAEDKNSVVTHAPSHANRANLSPDFIAHIESRFQGSFLGRQELLGEFVEDVPGALWSMNMIARNRRDAPEQLSRIVVMVDPPASHHRNSDECGIIVAGVDAQSPNPSDWHAYILADLSQKMARPEEWGAFALAGYRDFGADVIMAEVNQGGDMVEAILRQLDPLVNYHAVRAHQGKAERAEPISALYAQGRVHHTQELRALEDQMLLMTPRGFEGSGSPDRLDALVWALHELLIRPAQIARPHPKIRLV